MSSEVRIEEEDREYVVFTPYDEDWKEEAKELGARWDPDHKAWCFQMDEITESRLEAKLKQHFPRAFR